MEVPGIPWRCNRLGNITLKKVSIFFCWPVFVLKHMIYIFKKNIIFVACY